MSLENQSLSKEAIIYNLEQYAVLLPALAVILLKLDVYLIIFAVFGVVLDFLSALSKKFWILTSLITIPLAVGVYFGFGKALDYVDLQLPHTDNFSLETVAFGLIVSRFILSFITNGGIVLNYIDLMKQKEFKG